MSGKLIEIYFSCDTELSEWDAINKGYRSDVYVTLGGLMYRLNIYTPTRLVQDFNSEIKDYGFYSADENTVLISETDKKSIISLILKLHGGGYFGRIKSVTAVGTDSLVKVY